MWSHVYPSASGCGCVSFALYYTCFLKISFNIIKRWLISFDWVSTFDWNFIHIKWTVGLHCIKRVTLYHLQCTVARQHKIVSQLCAFALTTFSEFKINSNLKQYNNIPFLTPVEANNVLAMFWRIAIESKFNTCDVRCLATKIDGILFLANIDKLCCCCDRLFLRIFMISN